MSEEEDSFVILGTSPNTLNNDSLLSEHSSRNFRSINNISLTDKTLINSNISNDSNKFSFITQNTSEIFLDSPDIENSGRKFNRSLSEKENRSFNRSFSEKENRSFNGVEDQNLSLDGSRNVTAKEGSLAASFLLGDVQIDVLKATMHSQFPSLCSSSVKSEEMMKLQNILAEYIELKETLQKNNVLMRKHFATIQKWQDDVRIQKEEQNEKLNEFQEVIAKLRNENMELKNELRQKIEQININEDSIRRDNEEMTRIVSDKTAQIQNMAAQIEKLEMQHLESFEYIRKLRTENEEQQNDQTKITEHEYVPILEHKRIVTDLEQRLSECVAKNIELDEMKEKYLDEVKVLKQKLNSCQDELNNAKSDIEVLKCNDEERKKHFENYEKEKNEMKNEITILKTQVEIYSKDFEMERQARQNIAGEKEKILNDLRLLQKRNQELLENSKKRIETMETDSQIARSMSTSSASSMTSSVIAAEPNKKDEQVSEKEEQVFEPSNFICPLCNKQYKLLNDLQTHVQECIDN